MPAKISIDSIVLTGAQVHLRPLKVSDVTERYCAWLNDPIINQFLESRFQMHTVQSIRTFVENVLSDPAYAFFAICLNNGGQHVGNIKLGPISEQHKFSDIGLIIGERECHGKGIATEAIRLIKEYAFAGLGLHKLTASAYENNVGSIKAFVKAGFEIEGRRCRQYQYNNEYVDSVLLCCFKETL